MQICCSRQQGAKSAAVLDLKALGITVTCRLDVTKNLVSKPSEAQHSYLKILHPAHFRPCWHLHTPTAYEASCAGLQRPKDSSIKMILSSHD